MTFFNIELVKLELDYAFSKNSETLLLNLLKKNSFLLSEIYDRHFGIRPNFNEVSFGDTYRCDFCWLNDNSDGAEWVIVEIEKPKMKLFTKQGEPTSELNHAIEQIKSWQRYFDKFPSEKSRIFGAVSRFRWILVAGDKNDWLNHEALAWREHNNRTTNIEVRSSDIFYRALDKYEKITDHFWSFEEHPVSLAAKDLQTYCLNDDYLNFWKQRLN